MRNFTPYVETKIGKQRNVFSSIIALFIFCLPVIAAGQTYLYEEIQLQNESNYDSLNEFPAPYCSIIFDDEINPISRVIFGGIDNASSPIVNDSPDLEDFTSIVGNVQIGNRYEIRVEGNTDGNWLNSVVAYIDWNQDGVFEEDEMHAIGFLEDSDGMDGQQAFNTVLVPETALEGVTRMRIVKRFHDGSFTACGDGIMGQAEDYSLNVASSAGPCSKVYPGSFDNGIGNLQNLIFADDFEVDPNTLMEINQVTLRVFADISSADIYVYQDNNGIPGEVVESYNGLVPTSQDFVSIEFDFNTYEVIFDLPSTTSVLGGENGTKYWLGIKTYEGSEGSINYWETADLNTNALAHYSADGGNNWVVNNSNEDLAFIVTGSCEFDGSFAGCFQHFEEPGATALSISYDNENNYMVANDFIVEAGTKFTLEKLKIWISSDGEPTNFEISIYEDLNIGVGEQIGTTMDDMIVSYYPDGIFGWSTRWAVDFVLTTPLVFENDSQEDIHYWIGLSGDNSTIDEPTYWASFVHNNHPTHTLWRSLDGGENWIEFQHHRNGNKAEGMMIVYGGCELLLNVNDIETDDFSFYPNPVTDVLSILTNRPLSSISIFNIQGLNVLTLESPNKDINLSMLSAGVYISKAVFTDGSIETFKIIKE